MGIKAELIGAGFEVTHPGDNVVARGRKRMGGRLAVVDGRNGITALGEIMINLGQLAAVTHLPIPSMHHHYDRAGNAAIMAAIQVEGQSWLKRQRLWRHRGWRRVDQVSDHDGFRPCGCIGADTGYDGAKAHLHRVGKRPNERLCAQQGSQVQENGT